MVNPKYNSQYVMRNIMLIICVACFFGTASAWKVVIDPYWYNHPR